MLSPGLTLTHVIQMIALIALLVGALEVASGFHLRRHITDEWLLVSAGVISIAFAVCLLLTSRTDRHIVLTWIALYAAASGLAMAGLGFRLRNLRQSIHTLVESAAAAKAPAGSR
jgi:uncharacterized membrane protein HdeD (DUF308 family)